MDASEWKEEKGFSQKTAKKLVAKSEQSSLTNRGKQAAVEAWTVIRWSPDKGMVCAVGLNGARFLRNAGHQPKPNLVPLTEEQRTHKPMWTLQLMLEFYFWLSLKYILPKITWCLSRVCRRPLVMSHFKLNNLRIGTLQLGFAKQLFSTSTNRFYNTFKWNIKDDVINSRHLKTENIWHIFNFAFHLLITPQIWRNASLKMTGNGGGTTQTFES